jgi:predicted DNA-binding protein
MKTMAIRLQDDVHAQLSVVAQLDGTTVADEIRQAIEGHLARKRAEGGLADRASQALADIERDATARRDAIQALFGESAQEPAEEPPSAPAKERGRRGAKQEPSP